MHPTPSRPSRTTSLSLAALLVVSQLALLVALAPAAEAVGPTVNSVRTGSCGGPAASSDTNGGIVAFVCGANFGGTASNRPTVKFGSNVAEVCVAGGPTGCANPTSTQITVIVPARTSAGSVEVTVINPSLEQHSLSNAFTYTNAAAPTFTSISDGGVGTTNGGRTHVITGTNFAFQLLRSTVIFGDTTGQVLAGGGPIGCPVPTSTCLPVVTPPHASGQVALKIRNPDTKEISVANAYTYGQAAAPSFASINPLTPPSGTSTGGDLVTVAGAGFDAGAALVFGGVPAQLVTFTSATSMTFRTPPHAAGNVEVIIMNPDGQKATRANGFIYSQAAAPSLAINPLDIVRGPSLGGTGVAITGAGFTPVTNPPVVKFGGDTAQILWIDGCAGTTCTTIHVLTPPHTVPAAQAAETVAVQVINPDAQTVTAAAAFTYVQTVKIDGLNQRTSASNGGPAIKVLGSGFPAGSKVCFGATDGLCSGGTLVNPTASTATSLDVVAPPSGIAALTSDNHHALLSADDASLSARSFNFPPGTTATSFTVGFEGKRALPAGGTSPIARIDHRMGDGPWVLGTAAAVSGTADSPFTNAAVTGSFNEAQLESIVVRVVLADFVDRALLVDQVFLQLGGGSLFGGDNLGVRDVAVIAPDGRTAILEDGFHYTTNSTAPTLTCLNFVSNACSGTASGTTLGGTTLTMTGANFPSGGIMPKVCFGATDAACTGGALATASASNGATLTVTTPVNPQTGPADVAVRVINPDGRVSGAPSSGPTEFSYTGGGPTVTSLGTARGSPHGGFTTTITGSNFASSPKPVVLFGTAQAEVTAVGSQLTVVVPPHAGTGAVDVTVTNPDGQSGTLTGGFTYDHEPSSTGSEEDTPTPSLSSLSTSGGPTRGGTSLTITGTGFPASGAAAIEPVVCFGSTPPPPGGVCPTIPVNATSTSATSLTVVTPASIAGVVNLYVINPDGKTTSAVTFTYTTDPNTAPVITSASQTSSSLAGGSEIILSGSNFPTTGRLPEVCFGPNDGTYNFPTPSCDGPSGAAAGTRVTVLSSGSLRVKVPPHAAGNVNIVVTNPDTQSGSCSCFTYLIAPPSLSTLAGSLPDNTVEPGVDNATAESNGGAPVLLSGSGFVNAARSAFFPVSGGSNNAANVTGSTGSTLSVIAPPHAAGNSAILVVSPEGQSSNYPTSLARPFVYTPSLAPTVTSVGPSGGPAFGGNLVVIQGSGFATGSSAAFRPVVSFVPDGGSAKVGTTVASGGPAACPVPTDHCILVRAPSMPASLVDIKVTNPDGSAHTLTDSYRFLGEGVAAGPTITSISPSAGPPAGGTVVTITGTNFATTGAVTVRFGTALGTALDLISATQLRVTAPAGTGTVDVTVTNPDSNAATKEDGFTYTTTAAPTVAAVAPNAGPAAGGTAVTITGAGFATTGNVTVTFGGTAATGVTVASATSITATTPAHAAGVVNVVVTNPDTQFGTLTGGFTYGGTSTTAPTVTAVAPASGPAAGGTVVTITGTNFATTGTTTVTFGGTAATEVTVLSATSIRATTPAHAAGSVTVSVTTGGQTATRSGGFSFIAAVTAPTEAQLLAANDAITATLEVVRDGDSVTLTWTIPGDLPGVPLGIQIWQSINPVSLVDDLPASDPLFDGGPYVVEDAPKGAAYWITIYFGDTEEFGFVENADAVDSLDDLPDFANLDDVAVVAAGDGAGGDGGGLKWWAWALIILGILALVGLVLLIIYLVRGKKEPEEPQWDEGAQEGWKEEAPPAEGEWPAAETAPDVPADAPPAAEAAPAAAAGPEVHQVTCPKCSSDFTAHGQKPLVIECPSCHVRGMLR